MLPVPYWKGDCLPNFRILSVVLILLCLGITERSAQAMPLAPVVQLHDDNRQDPLVRLPSNWNMVWKRFIVPGQVPDEVSGVIKLPKVWNGMEVLDDGKAVSLPTLGYASYILRFTGLAPITEGYDVEILGVSSAFQAFLYPEDNPQDQVKARSGQVAETQDMLPSRITRTLRFYPASPDQVWVLLIHVSNFAAYKGGIWGVPIVGPSQAIDRMRINRASLELFCLGSTFFVGLYSLMMYFRRHEDLASLALFGSAVFGILRILSTGDWFYTLVAEEGYFVFALQTGIAYITVVLPVIFLLWFFHFSFTEYSSLRFVKIISAYALLLTALTIILPPTIYMRFLVLYQIPFLPIAVYCTRIFVKSFSTSSIGVSYSFAGVAVLGGTIVYDILISLGRVDPPYITQFGVLCFMFMQSQVVAQRFSRAFRSAEHLQKELQIEVEEQTAQIRSIMDHVPEGICLVHPDLTIQGHYAHHLEHIFETSHIQGAPILDLLFQGSRQNSESIAIAESCLRACLGEDIMNFEINQVHFPTEIANENNGTWRILETNWHPMLDQHNRIEAFLLTIRDITQVRLLERLSQHKDQELQMLLELLNGESDKLRTFWHHTLGELTLLLRLFDDRSMKFAETLPIIFRQLHTLKGVARSFKLTIFSKFLHDTESLLSEVQANQNAPSAQTSLQSRLAELQALAQNYQMLMSRKLGPQLDAGLIGVATQDIQDLEQITQKTSQQKLPSADFDSMKNALAVFCSKYLYRSFSQLIDDFRPDLDAVASELKKLPVSIEVLGQPLLVSLRGEHMLRNILMHLLHNALDHGIETPAVRRKRSKPEHGQITIKWESGQEFYKLTFADDGQGLNVQSLRAAALKKGLAIDISDSIIAEYIFVPNFSTKEELSTLSGRGGRNGCREIFGPGARRKDEHHLISRRSQCVGLHSFRPAVGVA